MHRFMNWSLGNLTNALQKSKVYRLRCLFSTFLVPLRTSPLERLQVTIWLWLHPCVSLVQASLEQSPFPCSWAQCPLLSKTTCCTKNPHTATFFTPLEALCTKPFFSTQTHGPPLSLTSAGSKRKAIRLQELIPKV